MKEEILHCSGGSSGSDDSIMSTGDMDIVWEPPTQLSSLDCWDYSIELDCLRGPEDLHLAAELGKTLLERNKELENCIKKGQCTIDDQAQEIEYLKKQTAAWREANDSRLKIYENLEVNIQDLERANQRLALENTNHKKQIKSQTITIENLESRLDELQKKYDEVNVKYETLVREQQQNQQIISQSSDVTDSAPRIGTQLLRDGSTQNMAVSPRRINPDEEARIQQLINDQDITKLVQQLKDAHYQRAREQKKVEELKEQFDVLLQDLTQREEELAIWKSKAQDVKNLQDEISTLEEVRQGHLCGRCLRGTDSRNQEHLSAMMDQEEEDDELSLAESFAESIAREADANLQEFGHKNSLSEEDSRRESYRLLVEKYEALLKTQQQSLSLKRKTTSNGFSGPLSLQEELQMSGDFSNASANSKCDSGAGSSCAGAAVKANAATKPFSGTPTDFSEAETSSSGFADETSNKSTQTEGRPPGSLLCSIADGEDCKLSIYDENSSFESRFHKTPEYRKIFSEIFEVLKRAAEAKDEAALLPLLDDTLTHGDDLEDDAPSEMTDDTRSIVSLTVSSVASEPVFRVHSPLFAKRDQKQQNGGGETAKKDETSAALTGLRPLHNNSRHQPLEYLSIQVKKKTGSAKRTRRNGCSESQGAADVLPSPNPRIRELKGGSRRKFRPLTTSEMDSGIWNGHTTHFYPSAKSSRNRHNYYQHQPQGAGDNHHTCSPSQHSSKSSVTAGGYGEYKPGSASEEVAKLRQLEMSYAEVLRTPPGKQSRPNRGYHQQRKNYHHHQH